MSAWGSIAVFISSAPCHGYNSKLTSRLTSPNRLSQQTKQTKQPVFDIFKAMRIGIDLGGTKIEGIVLSSDGAILSRVRRSSPRGNYSQTLSTIKELVRDLEVESGKSCPVGIGIPGTISNRTGLVKNANSTWLIGKPFREDLQATLERPVRLSNDANCFALSEAVDGAAAGSGTTFGVILGTGVGAGVVINGRVVDGPNGITGEWGHNPLPWPTSAELPGRACYCGKHGCIETFLSGPGLAADHTLHTQGQITAVEIAEEKDEASNTTLLRYEERLAKALASVINILDPEVIVLGGGLSKITRLYRNVPPLLDKWVFSDSVETSIRPPDHGDSSGVRGAAWLWPNDHV